MFIAQILESCLGHSGAVRRCAATLDRPGVRATGALPTDYGPEFVAKAIRHCLRLGGKALFIESGISGGPHLEGSGTSSSKAKCSRRGSVTWKALVSDSDQGCLGRVFHNRMKPIIVVH